MDSVEIPVSVTRVSKSIFFLKELIGWACMQAAMDLASAVNG